MIFSLITVFSLEIILILKFKQLFFEELSRRQYFEYLVFANARKLKKGRKWTYVIFLFAKELVVDLITEVQEMKTLSRIVDII